MISLHIVLSTLEYPRLYVCISPESCCGDQTRALIFDRGRGDSAKLLELRTSTTETLPISFQTFVNIDNI